ncbi:MAG: RNA polymerase sigma factor [Chlorobi bacterium]|nr:RNA polymerase sigma factor [Chlorobiota bacterium]
MNQKQKELRFSDIFNDNKEKVYRLCYSYLYRKEEVDDLFQEVMVNIWNNLENFRNEAKISTWIYRIAVNTALLYNKSIIKQKNVQLSYTNNPVITDTDSEQFNIEEKINLLRKAITHLKKQDKIIISLVLEGLTYEEISEVTGISSNYVGVKINRIKVILQKIMKNSNG